MATSMSNITRKSARIVIWMLIPIFLLQQVFPLIFSNSIRVWFIIKGSKFIYIVLNFIIISILISGSSVISYFTNLFLKLQKKSESQKFISQEAVSPPPPPLDEDTWGLFTYLDHEQPHMECATTLLTTTEVEKTVLSVRVHEHEQHKEGFTTSSTTKEEKLEQQQQLLEITKTSTIEEKIEWLLQFYEQHPPMESDITSATKDSTIITSATEEEQKTLLLLRVHEQEQQLESSTTSSTTEEEKTAAIIVLDEDEYCKEEKNVEEEADGLDATWKAIMESKVKGSRPNLKTSDICNGENEEMGGGLSKYKVEEQLKKWRSFRDIITVEKKEDIGCDRGGGKKRGWKSMEVALTFQDEFKKRADAFIARFTHDIRLQRLESDQRFMEMINRGR